MQFGASQIHQIAAMAASAFRKDEEESKQSTDAQEKRRAAYVMFSQMKKNREANDQLESSQKGFLA